MLSAIFVPISKQNSNHFSIRVNHGYTLIEIMVVMLLLSCIAGLTGMAFSKIYTSIEDTVEKDKVIRSLTLVGLTSLKNKKEFVLNQLPAPENPEPEDGPLTSKDFPIELPTDWYIKTQAPIKYTDDGICLGGTLTLGVDDRFWQFELSSPLGTPTELE